VITSGKLGLLVKKSSLESIVLAVDFGIPAEPPVRTKPQAPRTLGCAVLGGYWLVGRPVIDETGLTGNYDFVLKYKGRWDRDRPADDLDPMPPLDRALKEELGLKVEATKGPVKLLVIDHVEKPSVN
jgi:hypothetical protein